MKKIDECLCQSIFLVEKNEIFFHSFLFIGCCVTITSFANTMKMLVGIMLVMGLWQVTITRARVLFVCDVK